MLGLAAAAAAAPPSCEILNSGSAHAAGATVFLTASAFDPEGGRVSYVWHLGGGADAAPSGEVESGSTFSIPVAFAGSYQAFPLALEVTDEEGSSSTCRGTITVGTALPLAASVPQRPEPQSPRSQAHALLAFNDLGMHCADLGSVPFSILPPFNTVHAQVVERGDPPRLLADDEAELRYSAASNPDDPVLPPAVIELSDEVFDQALEFRARTAITTAGSVAIAPGGVVDLIAGETISLGDQFAVLENGVLTAALDEALLGEPPSINSTSRNYPVGASADLAILRKTDFWDPIDPADPGGATVASTLFGLSPPPDEGLATIHNVDGFGRRMPGIADPYVENVPQPFSLFQPTFQWFKAEGVPITAVDDVGRDNPYPLMRVEAMDPAGAEVLAALDAVVPVSTEVDCRDCHGLGEVGADSGARMVDLGFVAAALPGDRVSEEQAAKVNILRLHDHLHATALDAASTVLCAGCHNSYALEEVTGGGLAGDPALPSLSSAMHGHHGQFVVDEASGELVRDAAGEPIRRIDPEPGETRLIPVDPQDPAVRMERNCFSCHPGKLTQCFRGAMFAAGLKCSSCHGDMLATGGVFPGDFDHDGVASPRLPWRDEPRCESCHLGDAVDPGPASMLGALAFDPADPAAVPLLAANKRFAENESPSDGLILYRNSLGHGGVACEGCHGSTHAIWPNPDPRANDNVPALQQQGHAGTISECTVCHLAGSFPNGTLDGPHGLHPVNDPHWIKSGGQWHGPYAKNENGTGGGSGDRCAPCHGVDHLGTRLAAVPVERELRDASGRLWTTVEAGTVISCDLCHSLEKSFDD